MSSLGSHDGMELVAAADAAEGGHQDPAAPSAPPSDVPASPDTADEVDEDGGPSNRRRTSIELPSRPLSLARTLAMMMTYAAFLKESPAQPSVVVDWLMMTAVATLTPPSVKRILMRLRTLQAVYGPAFPRLPALHEMVWSTSRRIVHDVVETRGPSGLEERLLGQLLHHLWKLEFAVVAHHPKPTWDHCHVIHNCRWDRLQRRCGWSLFAKERRRLITYADGDDSHFTRLMQYIQSGDRRIILQKAARTLWVDLRQHPGRGHARSTGERNQGVVEVDGPQRPDADKPQRPGPSNELENPQHSGDQLQRMARQTQ